MIFSPEWGMHAGKIIYRVDYWRGRKIPVV
jgi:hypothetical protein